MPDNKWDKYVVTEEPIKTANKFDKYIVADTPISIEGNQSKLKEAISKDRSKVSSFIDHMIPSYVQIGMNAAKTAGSLLKGAISGVESLGYTMAELGSYMLPSAGVGAPSLSGNVEPLNPAQRKQMLKDVRVAGEQAKAAVPVSFNKQEAKFNVTDGFGFEDLKALPEIIGRVALDVPLGAATGGTTFFVQGYGDALKEYDETIERTGQESDEKTRQFYGVAGGAINGALEKFAIDKMFKGPAFTKIKTQILSDVLKRTAQFEGKLGVDAIELMVAQETKKAMSTMKNRGIKALYGAGVESGTEMLQTGLENLSRVVSNSIQGKEVFDEKEIKSTLFSQVVNAGAAGGILGFGMAGSMSFMKDTDNQILRSIANTNTAEEADILINDIENTLTEERMSEEEKEIVRNQVKKYSEIKRTIPKDTPSNIQETAIGLIEARNEIDNQIKAKEAEIESLDEAVAVEEKRTIELFKDARNSFNDRIRDVISGEKTKYYEKEGNYYKQIGENEPEFITKNRFEFEQTYDENVPTGPTNEELTTQEVNRAIENLKKQRDEEHGGLLKSPLTNVNEYEGDFTDDSIDAYVADIKSNNKLSKKANQALDLWQNTAKDINKRYNEQVQIENNKLTTDATTTTQEQQQEGQATSNISEYQGTEGQQNQATNEADNSNSNIPEQTQQVGLPTAPIKNKVALFFKKQFNPFGVIGRTLTSLKEKIPGYISAEMKRAEMSQKKAGRIIQKYKNAVTPEDIDNYLSGKETINPIPQELAGELTKLREHIDAMTESLIETGVITDPTEIELFRSNKGSYLTRAYELFDKKGVTIDNVVNKLKNVDQTVLDNALEFLADVIYNQAKQGDLFSGNESMTREQAMELAKIEANKILANEENPFTKKKIEGSLNAKALKERQDVAAPLRALMGEYTDPLHKYAITVYKMAGLISSQRYMTELRNIGLGKFLFKEGDPNMPPEATALMAGEGSQSAAPLAGLYTFPELKEALEQAEKEKTFMLTKVAGTIRAFKTVYNPMTHVKNVLGNLGFLVSNAHWSESKEAFELVRELVTGKDNKKLNELIFKLNEFGVLNNTVGIGELRAYFDNHKSLDELIDNVYNKQDNRIKRYAKSSWNALKNGPQVAYQMEDDIFKIIAYVNESKRYAQAIYKTDYNSLSKEQKKEIDEKTSEIVKNTYPTFSRVPKFVKSLSRAMFVGNFLAFPVESVRVSYESLRLAKSEIDSGNEVLRKVGWQRIAGTIAYNSLVSSATYMGVLGASGLVGMFSSSDEEKRKQKSARKYMADWNKNKDAYFSKFSDGKLIYMDIGSSDPYGYQKEVFNTFWNNINDKKGFSTAMANTIVSAAEPFTEIDMTVKAVGNLIYNEDNNGNEIVKSSDNVAEKGVKIASYLNKNIAPGAITTAVKMYNFYNDDKDKFSAEAASLSGYRVYNVDLLKQFSMIVNSKDKGVLNPKGAFSARIKEDYIRVWNSVKLGNKTQEFKESEYNRLSNGLKDVLKEMRGYYEAAIDGGVKDLDLVNSMIKSGIPRSHIQMIRSNNFDKPNAYYLRR
jgi:hypothetical protein